MRWLIKSVKVFSNFTHFLKGIEEINETDSTQEAGVCVEIGYQSMNEETKLLQ